MDIFWSLAICVISGLLLTDRTVTAWMVLALCLVVQVIAI